MILEAPQVPTIQQVHDIDTAWNSQAPGGVWRRQTPAWSQSFFDQLLTTVGDFRQQLTPQQIPDALRPLLVKLDPEQSELWIQDAVQLATAYCQTLKLDKCVVHLDRDRPCRKFHADNLRLRLVCTYRGPGTLWNNADVIEQCGEWDVLLMKGRKSSPTPLIHKSPDPNPEDPPSLLLKLDEPGWI